jgi:hypothetical protein
MKQWLILVDICDSVYGRDRPVSTCAARSALLAGISDNVNCIETCRVGIITALSGEILGYRSKSAKNALNEIPNAIYQRISPFGQKIYHIRVFI